MGEYLVRKFTGLTSYLLKPGRCFMRFIILFMAVSLAFPLLGRSEPWEFSCTEAIALVKAAQERVVRNHDHLQEAKFSLRQGPAKFEGCRSNRRGFQGGKIQCVTHQSRQGTVLREILTAQQNLDASLQEFETYQKRMLVSCTGRLP